jgi:hypothetical protein
MDYFFAEVEVQSVMPFGVDIRSDLLQTRWMWYWCLWQQLLFFFFFLADPCHYEYCPEMTIVCQYCGRSVLCSLYF